MYAQPAFAEPMRVASYFLLPSRRQKRLRVKAGPAMGLVFELNPRWEHTAWEGTYEQSLQRLFVKFLRPGTIVFDVGANYGFYAVLAAREGADVFAFEPDKENAEALARHADMNGLAFHIHIVSSAVYSYTGNIALEPPDMAGSHGNAHTRPQESETVNAMHVPCITLDNFIQTNPQPNLVKMDVEGAESEVLKGADQLFHTSRPYLLCEIHDQRNASFVEVWLAEHHYTFAWVGQESSFPRHLFASPE
jgi:FkbM family methyltransferase